jgi:hypothetical protein
MESPSEGAHDVEMYGDPGIASAHAPIPRWLLITYVVLPIWGILIFLLFWNGASGWLDRGYWFALEQAANTTFPQKNHWEPTKADDKPAPQESGRKKNVSVHGDGVGYLNIVNQ